MSDRLDRIEERLSRIKKLVDYNAKAIAALSEDNERRELERRHLSALVSQLNTPQIINYDRLEKRLADRKIQLNNQKKQLIAIQEKINNG